MERDYFIVTILKKKKKYKYTEYLFNNECIFNLIND